MNNKLKTAGLILAMLLACINVQAKGSQETETEFVINGINDVAAALGVTKDELIGALGDPKQGPPDFEVTAEELGVSAEKLEALMKMMPMEESVEVDPYTITLNGKDYEVSFEVFSWDELPSDIACKRQAVQAYTNAAGETHYYEAVYVSSGNLNWYQAAWLAEKAGGYLACPTTEEENAFVFSLINDPRYFWTFPEEGGHYGISIGPFLGGYQPEGSAEPDGGWTWLSGEAWEYTNWAQNLDDGIVDKDPRDNTQPNNSGESQPIMGFGEMNLPVATWGDYMENVGTYGLKKSPGQSYGFIIEYESYNG